MEENKIPMPTGITPAPTPTPPEEKNAPQPEPVAPSSKEPAPEDKNAETEEFTDETGETDDVQSSSLLDVDPPLILACSALLGSVIPFFSIILPFTLWIMWRDKDPDLNESGKAVLNVQLTAAMWISLTAMSTFISIGFVLLPLAILGWACVTIIQILKISRQEYVWLAPGTIPFIR